MDNSANSTFRCAILICSDRASTGKRPDETAPLLQMKVEKLGFIIVSTKVIPDIKAQIVNTLREWAAEEVDLILTSGGTGMAPTDVTPEATLEVIEKRVPGMEEQMRRISMDITSHAMLSRSVVGIINRSLIVNLPGNPKGAVENLEAVEEVLEHGLELIRGTKVDK